MNRNPEFKKEEKEMDQPNLDSISSFMRTQSDHSVQKDSVGRRINNSPLFKLKEIHERRSHRFFQRLSEKLIEMDPIGELRMVLRESRDFCQVQLLPYLCSKSNNLWKNLESHSTNVLISVL